MTLFFCHSRCCDQPLLICHLEKKDKRENNCCEAKHLPVATPVQQLVEPVAHAEAQMLDPLAAETVHAAVLLGLEAL